MNGSHSDYRGKLRCQNETNAYGDSRAHSRRDEHHQNVHICVDEEGYDTIGEAGNICRDIQPRNNHSVRSRRRRTREQGYQKKKEVSVLKNVNMTFPEKGMTAIVGESGCGKSTVVNMLIGAFRPQKGEVTVGGKALEKLSRENWYSHLSAVSYNTYIFNESVRDNFKMAKENVSDEEIFAALEKVNLKEFIEENGGLDKVITEDANNISGGQKQRLALAIALVSDKDIYVFDEATSNIDIDSESIIMNNIKTLSGNRSVIVISHRLANVVPADNIYYMDDGEIKESGAHDELMAANKGYARLYNTQKTLEQGYTEAIA